MSALLLDIQPGDEIIVPAFTFVSTINAFVLRGAKPIFIDIRPDTLNFNERLLEGLITPRTKAIIVVHYAGVGCEMETIMEIANRHHIPVVEDNAHGLFGKSAVDTLAQLEYLPHKVFMRRRISLVERVGRYSLMICSLLSAPRSFARKAPIAVAFFEVKSINTPGVILVRATCLQTCWQHIC
jgi:hypothetical protein